MKDLKFTACQLMYTFMKADVAYSKVKRINRGYVTHYTIKLMLRDQDYSSIIIEERLLLLLR